MIRAFPLLFAVLILAVFAAVPYSPKLDAIVARTAYSLFDGDDVEPEYRRERLLRSASIGTPYREYATKTYLYMFAAAAAGAIIGVYFGIGALAVARRFGIVGEGATIGEILTGDPDGELFVELATFGEGLAAFDVLVFVVLFTASAIFGSLGAVGAYLWRWQAPSLRADTRRRQIDAGMPRMVAFIYALSRGGMAFPDVMRTLSRNRGVFGEAAAEMGTGVRNIDVFNVDLVSAVQDLSQRTPSEQFESFAENLTSVLQSGRDLSEFLQQEYERYREEAEEQQEEILDLLATTAEVYVTVVVAGMLFLITILLIIGLTAGDTLFLVRLLTYIALPAGNLLFLAYLLEITQPLRATRDTASVIGAGDAQARTVDVQTNGGYGRPSSRINHERLAAYQRISRTLRILSSPVRSAIERPVRVLYVAIPIAILFTLLRLPAAFVDGSVDVRVLDDLVVQAILFVMGSFAIVYETSRRRLKKLESAVPDLLERLASLNEAGIAVVSSFDRVRRSDVGALDEEVDRIWRDIQWGASIEEALGRFEQRVQTPSITRVVTLLTNAMHASNDIGPVLRIAAEQARADKRLERQRKQEMFTYLVVIYVAFLVFLVVILALDQVLIPSLPDTETIERAGEGGTAPGFISFETGDPAAYRLAFFHSALLQSALSGLVGGVLGGGSIKDGAKHSTIMLTITYLLLSLL